MNKWILNTAIARLLSANAVVFTELNFQMVGKHEVILFLLVCPSFACYGRDGCKGCQLPVPLAEQRGGGKR